MPYRTLVDSDTLARHLNAPNWCIFDCRFDLADTKKGHRAYLDAHIPGARYAHLDHDLSGPITAQSGRHPLPDPEAFAGWVRRSGVNRDAQIIVYDDTQGTMAVRLWWMMKWLGHPHVAVLDGGWQAWIAGGYPTDTRLPAPASGDFAGTPAAQHLADTAALARGLGGWTVVDVRTAPRFRGELEPIDPIAGHIPGAVNLPLAQHLAPDGRFLTGTQLAALYTPILERTAVDRLVFMCGSGVTACHGILALEIAGHPGARLYPGSWSEWIRDPERPIALGGAESPQIG